MQAGTSECADGPIGASQRLWQVITSSQTRGEGQPKPFREPLCRVAKRSAVAGPQASPVAWGHVTTVDTPAVRERRTQGWGSGWQQ